jgi:hypothetical protein
MTVQQKQKERTAAKNKGRAGSKNKTNNYNSIKKQSWIERNKFILFNCNTFTPRV